MKIADTKLNYLSFLLAKAQTIYDLDNVVLISGYARTGKSTLALLLLTKIYAFNMHMQIKDAVQYCKTLLKDNIFYIPSINKIVQMYAEKEKQVFIIDEGYFTADKRDALNKAHNELIKSLNAYANHNHISFVLLQDLADFDYRYFKKAKLLIQIYKRGKALLFGKTNNFAFRKNYFGLENLINGQIEFNDIFKNLHYLKHRSSYIFQFRWAKLQGNLPKKLDFYYSLIKENKPILSKRLYTAYLIYKSYYQNLYMQAQKEKEKDAIAEMEIINYFMDKKPLDKTQFYEMFKARYGITSKEAINYYWKKYNIELAKIMEKAEIENNKNNAI